MKDFIIILDIITIIFGGDFLLIKYFEESGQEIITMLENMSGDIYGNNHEEKTKKVNELKEKWDVTQKKWILFQYHEGVNSMEDLMIECYNYYLTENKEQFEISSEKLKRSIEDLKYREEISMLNIM